MSRFIIHLGHQRRIASIAFEVCVLISSVALAESHAVCHPSFFLLLLAYVLESGEVLITHRGVWQYQHVLLLVQLVEIQLVYLVK